MIVDFHAHLIPGVDDGAQTAEEARVALERVAAASVVVQIATPHIAGSLTGDGMLERLAQIDVAWQELKRIGAEATPGLALKRGAELKLDIPTPDASDPRLRLDGGPFVLVEFPFMSVPPFAERPLEHLRAHGYVPIIAHPERYTGVDDDVECMRSWRDAGALLQVNGASLIGKYGEEAQARAFNLLERGWVDYLGSDYHARGRVTISAYRDALCELGADEHAELLTETNPARLLEGAAPMPVPPLRARRKGFFDRIASALR